MFYIMKKLFVPTMFSFFVIVGGIPAQLVAQVPKGREFGIGVIAGEPTGVTAKYWVGKNALIANMGVSSFGVPRMDIGYTFHFNTFGSRFVKSYATTGFALGVGEGGSILFDELDAHGDEMRFGLRFAFGVNILLARVPLEFFIEAGTLRGIGSKERGGIDASVGARLYP